MGQTIIGAAIGALVGLAAYVGLEIATGQEMFWFPVIVGLLTGLGVRQLNSAASMHSASYLRGAIAGVIALAAIAGAPAVKGMVMKRGINEDATKPKVEKAETPEDDGDEGEGGEGDEAEVEAPVERRPPSVGTGVDAAKGPAVPGEPDVWQGVFMALGAFVAYEFARGSGGAKRAKPAAEGEAASEPPVDESAPASEPPKQDA